MLIVVASLVGPPIIYRDDGLHLRLHPDGSDSGAVVSPCGPDGRSRTHPMGTDNAGRDMLARVLLGGRISLMVGIISTLVSLIIGITYGATAGYLGGKLDEVMMRIVDVLYRDSLHDDRDRPAGAVRQASRRSGQLFLLFAALGAVSWLTMARIVRGQVISLKNQEFVLAARATGVSDNERSSSGIWCPTRSDR